MSNVVSRSLGTHKYVDLDVKTYPRPARARYLLCSDGLCGVLDDAELAAFLRNSDDLDEACSLLIRRALAAGSRDNITVVLAKNDGGEA